MTPTKAYHACKITPGPRQEPVGFSNLDGGWLALCHVAIPVSRGCVQCIRRIKDRTEGYSCREHTTQIPILIKFSLQTPTPPDTADNPQYGRCGIPNSLSRDGRMAVHPSDRAWLQLPTLPQVPCRWKFESSPLPKSARLLSFGKFRDKD